MSYPVPAGIPTFLVITPISPTIGFDLTPYSARFVTQTLTPISGAGQSEDELFPRTINGKLLNLLRSQFYKYQTTITCRDVRPPVLDDSWLGQDVQIDCTVRLFVSHGGTPARPVVPGSEFTDESGFVRYRPRLQMKITSIARNDFNEPEAEYAWQLQAKEL